jgi:hypothetical protein
MALEFRVWKWIPTFRVVQCKVDFSLYLMKMECLRLQVVFTGIQAIQDLMNAS